MGYFYRSAWSGRSRAVISCNNKRFCQPFGICQIWCFLIRDYFVNNRPELVYFIDGHSPDDHIREIIRTCKHGIWMIAYIIFRAKIEGRNCEVIIHIPNKKHVIRGYIRCVIHLLDVCFYFICRCAGFSKCCHCTFDAFCLFPINEILDIVLEQLMTYDEHF